MTKHWKLLKRGLCEAIVDHKMNPKKNEAPKKKKSIPINRKRFIITLFNEDFIPKLVN